MVACECCFICECFWRHLMLNFCEVSIQNLTGAALVASAEAKLSNGILICEANMFFFVPLCSKRTEKVFSHNIPTVVSDDQWSPYVVRVCRKERKGISHIISRDPWGGDWGPRLAVFYVAVIGTRNKLVWRQRNLHKGIISQNRIKWWIYYNMVVRFFGDYNVYPLCVILSGGNSPQSDELTESKFCGA